jgi:hypothetical protein
MLRSVSIQVFMDNAMTKKVVGVFYCVFVRRFKIKMPLKSTTKTEKKAVVYKSSFFWKYQHNQPNSRAPLLKMGWKV